MRPQNPWPVLLAAMTASSVEAGDDRDQRRGETDSRRAAREAACVPQYQSFQPSRQQSLVDGLVAMTRAASPRH